MAPVSIEEIVRGVVKRLASEFANKDLDLEELRAEGALIALERVSSYDKSKGAALSSYLYGEVYGRLRNYINRVMLKDLYGTKDFVKVPLNELQAEGYECNYEDAITVSELHSALDDVGKDVMEMIMEGYTYQEIADKYGITRQAVRDRVKNWGKRV